MKTLDGSIADADPAQDRERIGLVLLWARGEPGRSGDLLLPSGEVVVGREQGGWVRQRPGEAAPSPTLESLRISRRQLHVEPRGEGLLVRSLSEAPLLVGDRSFGQATVTPGDLIEVERRLLMLCVRRPARMEGDVRDFAHRFGEPDANGLVGESPAAWRTRLRAHFAGRRDVHVLVLGDSGSGKELVASAIHRASSRAGGPLVSRNAATIPEGLADAELFGNIRNYPNPGTPERPGLVGQADGGTLFLDEIGEMPTAVQAHLLRLLDSGEYTRLGEAKPRRANLRVVAATNRDPAELKHDVAARFRLRVEVPGLDERVEDVPMLARHVLKRLAASDRELADLFFSDGEPRLSIDLVRSLVTHPYRTNVRELEGLLWRAIDFSGSGELLPPPDAAPPASVDADDLTPDRVRAALEEAGGVKSRAAEILGLRNRHQLRRLMDKLGL